MSAPWYIDALDARAGLAFASRRLLQDVHDPSLDSPCVFIAAPMFRPETVSNRALAFVGTRNSYQLGLFVQSSEVAFPGLEAVIDFVRRAYLRGGGGDGAAGIGPGVPPPPPEGEFPPGGGEAVGLPERPSVVQALLSDAQSFHSTSNSLHFMAAVEFETREFEISFPSQGSKDSAAQILAAGAGEIVLELLRRFPLTGDDEPTLTWFGSAHRLGRAITALGLWQTLSMVPWGPTLRRSVDDLSNRLQRPMRDKLGFVFDWAAHQSGFDLAVVQALLLQYPMSFFAWYPRAFEELLYRMREFTFPALTNSISPATDPIDDLACWPVSKPLAHLAGAPVDVKTSVHDLLCLVIGSPDVLYESHPAIADHAAALSIFAAAHIANAPNPVPALGLMGPEFGDTALNQITNVAARWLASQFPRYIFPRPIENILRAASRLAYA